MDTVDAAALEASRETTSSHAEEPSCVDQSTSATATAPAAAEQEGEEHPFAGETFYITSELLESLKNMGFSENAIKKSIAAGCINEDTCMQWITMHHGHPELDTSLDPMVRVLVKEKRVLTEEEKLAKIEELKEKIRLKKIQDELDAAERERTNEKKRIEMGKLMLEAKELREAQQRAQAYEERRREKEADALAREKVQMDLAIDRYVRQGKTPEDAARLVKHEFEERKKRQREEAALLINKPKEPEQLQHEQPSAPSGGQKSEWNLAAVVQGGNGGGAGGTSLTNHAEEALAACYRDDASIVGLTPTVEVFQDLIRRIHSEAPSHAQVCCSTLRTILTNTIEAPLDIKKRTLKGSSQTFANKVAVAPSALVFLRVIGFELAADEQGGSFVVLHSLVMRRLHRALEALSKS